MIKNLFIPEKIGNYYLFPKRIIGFDLGKAGIAATKIYLNGDTKTIEKIIDQPLEPGTPADYQDRVGNALASMLKTLGSYDEIHVAMPLSMVILRELTLPFTSEEKIRMVLDYEVEQLLPFSIDQAVLDFIITKKFPEQEKSEILVAVTQKHYLAELLAFFQAAGASPAVVTVDIFSLYELYKELPPTTAQTVVLMNIGFSTTRIAYLLNGQLKLVRALPKGMLSVIKAASGQLHLPAADIHELMLRFGFSKEDDPTYTQQIQSALNDFLSEIAFTLQTFSQKGQSPEQIVILGLGAEINGMTTAIQQQCGVPTVVFPIQTLFDQKKLILKDKNNISQRTIMSIGIAEPTSFNLRTKEFSVADTTLFTKQIIIAGILTLLTVSMLVGNSYVQVKKLKNSIAQSEKQVLTILDQTLNVSGTKRVDDAVELARTSVTDQERTWFSFTARTRSSFLYYLQKLSTSIDRQSIGLRLKRLSFTHNNIRLQGEVRDIPALVILEEELKQANLGTATSPQEPIFTIVITLKKEIEEG